MFGPSRFFSLGTMASADFSQFVVTTHFFRIRLLHASVRPPRVLTHSFPLYLPYLPQTIPCSYWIFFGLSWSLVLIWGLIYGFCSSGQSFAAAFLQTPPHDGRPWLRLYPSHCRVDSGLSPVRTCAHRAHSTNRVPQRGTRLLFYLHSPKPMGFLLCQFQESRHISARVFSAFQPRTSALLAGSA